MYREEFSAATGWRCRFAWGLGASAQLTTTGATRVYRSRGDNLSAIQINEIAVEEKGLLEYVPDAIIPFADARFQQQTRIQLSAGAGLFWWEILAPGREARGECFAYARVGLKTEIRACGRLIAFENVDLEPAKIHMGAIARLGVYRYWITFYVCRAGVESSKWLAAEAHMRETAAPWCRPGEMLWSVSALPADGLAIRGLARSGREILPALQALWSSAKVFSLWTTADSAEKSSITFAGGSHAIWESEVSDASHAA